MSIPSNSLQQCHKRPQFVLTASYWRHNESTSEKEAFGKNTALIACLQRKHTKAETNELSVNFFSKSAQTDMSK